LIPRARRPGLPFPLSATKRLIEDLHDLAVVAERRDEQPISVDEMKRRLKRDELLSAAADVLRIRCGSPRT
jgi:hypothetical protein